MSGNSGFSIRPMRSEDLFRAIELSSSEGWNQTEHDWKLLMDNPLNTCIVSEYRNKVIGTATALNHSGEVAWIGMVLVDREFRGQGAGKMLLSSLIEMLPGIRSIKLDATPAGQPLYEKLGFRSEHVIFRMTNNCLKKKKYDTTNESLNIDQKSLSEVLHLDKELFGTDRSYLLRSLYKAYPGKAFLIRKNDSLEGYIFGRDGIRFNYVGPLFAFSDDSARALLERASESLMDKPVALDVLEDKAYMIDILESAGFVKQRYFNRMFLKSNFFPGNVKCQYMIGGPEFG
jgi:ribosomal protein S18 acetylase RimI-like enzyme